MRLCSINAAAEAAGLRVGSALADARAILPDLASVEERPERDAAFLNALGRWGMRYTPWLAVEPPDTLTLDMTGSAHLFGGEESLLEQIMYNLNDLGLTVRIGMADTKGGAWALSRFATGIAPPGSTREAVTPLPVAALRIKESTATSLNRLGLRRIGDIAGMPRGTLARRFGADLVRRLDQILGVEPEPVAPANPAAPYAVRMALPEPIGKTDDVMAALLRLLTRLCERMERDQHGARRMRFAIQRTDHTEEVTEIGLARPSRDAPAIARLFERAVDAMDAGFGIEATRLQAMVTEPLSLKQNDSFSREARDDDVLSDLIARIGNRIGFDHVTRFLPAQSHIPERAFTVAAAAYSTPESFPSSGLVRPLLLFTPEPIQPIGEARPPNAFNWRGMAYQTQRATGPERIAPEWWWDDPTWRNGVRDYWRIQTAEGRRLWLFHAKGAETRGGWFTQGEFA